MPVSDPFFSTLPETKLFQDVIMKMLSPIMSIARGSVGAQVFTANQHAQIVVRARTSPFQPNTTYQQQAKAAWTAANTAWRALSQADRDGWHDYAQSLVYAGPIGNYSVPGRQVFLSNYSFGLYLWGRAKLPAAPLTDPPIIPGTLAIEDLSIHSPAPFGNGFYITAANPNPETVTLVSICSTPKPLTRLRWKGPWNTPFTYISTAAPGASFRINYYGFTPNVRYFCRVRAITTGSPIRLSALFYLNVITIPAP